MKTLKRVGSVATGAIMLGAAMSGAVSAAMDDTGLTKDFFYDADYNPIVQIVLGEKGMATDAVAGGNVAAVIGNLAYTSAMAQAGGSASGQVVLGISARGATGKFEKSYRDASWIEGDSNFYDRSDGLDFDNQAASSSVLEEYKFGEFVQYSLACDQQQRTAAGILKKGTYSNIHCLFCQTLCLGQLENPSHDMEEYISVDYTNMKWYEDGLDRSDAEEMKLKVPTNTLKYYSLLEDIPLTTIYDSNGTSKNEVDFEYRGKMILFGEEYYIKDISGTTKIYLAKGKILDDVSSEGYTAEYLGYKFKVDHLIYSAEYQVAGILLDVEKPDGTVVQTQISKMANGIVDDIEIAGVYAEEADAVATASLLVYDTTTNVVLEDGKELELGGVEKDGWKVEITEGVFDGNTGGLTASQMDIAEYDDMFGKTLNNISVTYTRSHTGNNAIAVDEMIEFPTTYQLKFNGFRDNNYDESPCSGAGNGNIIVSTDGDSRAMIAFTTDTGSTLENVYIDSGPIQTDEMFVAAGNVYEFESFDDTNTEDNQMKLTFTDVLNGGNVEYTLTAVTGGVDTMYQGAFVEALENDAELAITTNADDNSTNVFAIQDSAFSSLDLLLDDSDRLYVMSDLVLSDNTVSGVNGTVLTINPTVLGELTEFQLDDQTLTMSAQAEATSGLTYQRARNSSEGTDYNGDNDYDDVLIGFEANSEELMILDLFDRSYNSSSDTTHSMKLIAEDDTEGLTDTSRDTGSKQTLEDDKDSVLYTPYSGMKATLDWGSNDRIDGMEVCMPQDIVYSTIFVGTSEQATTMDAIITKDDEGTEKTVGCCSYLVKEFGVEATVEDVNEVTVNPIVGNLVVPEIQANTAKNLIIVGGPSVNGMSEGLVTLQEVQSSSGNYIVKKVGSKLIIAGLTAADTVDGGNELVSWLQANVH